MYPPERFIRTRSYADALAILKKADESSKVKNVIIDTVYYMIMDEYMDKAFIKNFDKYVEMGFNFWKLVNFIAEMKSDTFVVLMSHTDTEDFQRVFSVPGGKLVKEKVKPEGLQTVVLETEVKYDEGVPSFQFLTQHRGDGIAKSPAEMFPGQNIPNDLAYVKACMEAYENGEDAPPLPESKKEVEPETK